LLEVLTGTIYHASRSVLERLDHLQNRFIRNWV
jgi:hypothetical protein